MQGPRPDPGAGTPPAPLAVVVLAYALGDALYLQLTNRCTLACRFCPKVARRDFRVGPFDLKLECDPSTEEVWAQAAAYHPERFREVVFCGMGEPTLRLTMMIEIAQRLRAAGVRWIRVNTDGLASLVYGRDVARELKGVVNAVSVSLNAADASTYARICPSRHHEAAHGALRGFIRSAVEGGLHVTATAVALPDLDLSAVRAEAHRLGAHFRARTLDVLGPAHPRP